MIIFDQDASKTEYYSYDADKDEHKITTVQDVSALLDAIKQKRESTQQFGKVEEFAHYATIPTTVIIDLKNKGIDIFNKDHTKAMLKEINTTYPYLKTTTKYHA